MAAPFGCLVPGGLPITQFNQLAPSKWSAMLPTTPDSIIVYLTGIEMLPPDQALSVYLSRADQDSFAYAGFLTNEVPSAVLRVPSQFLNIDQPVGIIVGFSLESMDVIRNLGVPASQSLEQFRAATRMQIAKKVVENLHTYVVSHAKVGVVPGMGNEEIVCLPASWVDQWRQRITSTISKDASFWNSE